MGAPSKLCLGGKARTLRCEIVPRGTIVSAITSIHAGVLSVGWLGNKCEIRAAREIVARLKIVPRGTIVITDTGVSGELRSIWSDRARGGDLMSVADGRVIHRSAKFSARPLWITANLGGGVGYPFLYTRRADA